MAESFFERQPPQRPEPRHVVPAKPAPLPPARQGEDYSAASLTPGENVLYRAQLHGLAAGKGVGAVVASITLLFAAGSSLWTVFLAGLLIGAVVETAAYMRLKNSQLTLTDRRVLAKVGWISQRSIEIPLTKIESVAVEQGVAGHIVGYGTIVVTGTGGTRELLPGITDPMEFRTLVLSHVGR